MNPLRWEVLGLALVLALPVLAMGWRGDLSMDEVITRLPWCLAAAWGALAILHAFTRPAKSKTPHARPAAPKPAATEEAPAATS